MTYREMTKVATLSLALSLGVMAGCSDVKTTNVLPSGEASSNVKATASPSPTANPSAQAKRGNVTTFAGTKANYGSLDATGTAAQFKGPEDLVSDAQGNLYVADAPNNCIRKISPAGVVTTLAGDPDSSHGLVNANGKDARFYIPAGVAIDGNILYVADSYNNAIRRIDLTNSAVTTLAGGTSGNSDGTGTAAQFNFPTRIAVDAHHNLFVTDKQNFCIRKIDTTSGAVTTWAGSTNGYKDGTGTAAQFSIPYDLAFDQIGNLYVTDAGNDCVRKIAPDGAVTTYAGSNVNSGYEDGTGTAAQFSTPKGISVDAQGNLYVADSSYGLIRKIAPDRTVTRLAGGFTQINDYSHSNGFVDGLGTAAFFDSPDGIEVLPNGTMFVADYGNICIRKIEIEP